MGGPDARVLRLSFTPQKLMLGDELRSRRSSETSGRCRCGRGGPAPGFTYSSFDSFSTVENRQDIDRVGVWRFGVDWAGSPTASGSKYPYRWGLGRDLEPGGEATVTGKITMDHGPNLDRMVGPPQNRFFLYGGLIHEGSRSRTTGSAAPGSRSATDMAT